MRTIHAVLLTAVMLGVLWSQGPQPAMVGMPEYGVLLTGAPEDPVLENRSGKVVIGYDMNLSDAAGRGMIFSAQIMAISVLPAGIPDGGAIYVNGNVPVGYQRAGRAVAHSRRGQNLIVGATLRSIVFGDGEFVGVDPDAAFEQFGKKLKGVREVGVLAKRHGWRLVEAFAEMSSAGPPPRMTDYLMYSFRRVSASLLTNGWHGWDALTAEFWAWPGDPNFVSYDRFAASTLVNERRRNGDAASERLAEIYSSLPTPWRH